MQVWVQFLFLNLFPTVSELRVVLLGSRWTEKNEVGNLLLGQTLFSSQPDSFVRISGPLEDKKLVLINTPYLPPFDTSKDELTKFIKECEKHSAPGPHVFLLLVQPENFTKEKKQRLCRVLEGYSDRSFFHSLILFSALKDGSSGSVEDFMKSSTLNEMIKKCKCRYLKRSDITFSELLRHFGEIVTGNKGEHVSYKASDEAMQTLEDDQQNPKPKQTKTPTRDAAKATGK